MRLYLDNCLFNRPFDDLEQPRIWFETLSLSFILSLIEFGEAELLHSVMHDIENRRNVDSRRRLWTRACLQRSVTQPFAPDDVTIARADYLRNNGFRFQDAWHLAFAEKMGADYFLTCDDGISKRYSGPMKIVNPTTFISNLR